MSLRIVTTPIPASAAVPRPGRPRAVSGQVLEAVLAGPGRDRLAAGPVLVVTTGQQPGLFTGPLYTIHKAFSARALARRLERERGIPVIPVFWVAGDDHDFREGNHTFALDAQGKVMRVELRARGADAPQWPLSRELCGPEIHAALDRLAVAFGDAPFAAETLDWLRAAYRPEANLADAFATALHAVLGPRGIAVFRAHHPSAKAAAAPTVLGGLNVTLHDGLTPVLVEGRLGRDRLRAADGAEAFITRRSGEHFSRQDLEALAQTAPTRLSPNVLLRPVVEAALFPTVAYVAGPAELGYLPEAAPLYEAAGEGVEPQTPLPRWSGVIVETRIDHLLRKLGVGLEALGGPSGELEGRLIRGSLPSAVTAALAALRRHLEEDHARLAQAAGAVDPTLERSVAGAGHAAQARTGRVERRIIAAEKRRQTTLTAQIARARAALYPDGRPQERVLTIASFLARYGPSLLDDLDGEVARTCGAA